MESQVEQKEYDVIIVGSGTCGATIARELSRQGKKVMLLEQGRNTPLRESVLGIASVLNVVPVNEEMKAMRAITTGGSTALYFAVAMVPPLDAFRALGIDLSGEYDECKKELPLAELPDELLGAQAILLRESMMDLGYSCKKNPMLIDQSQCRSGYSYEAKWKARSFVQEAVNYGATLVNGARVSRVLFDGNTAVGVAYTRRRLPGTETLRVYGKKVILAAGTYASPRILRDSGMKGIADRGFYCDPGCALFGVIPGLQGTSNFVGSMDTGYVDDISLGDANLSTLYYRMVMAGSFKFNRLFSFPEGIGIGVKIRDSMGGEFRENGRYHKPLTSEDRKKLKKGEESAVKILKHAGAKHIFNSGVTCAGHVGGMIRIQEHVDEKLETPFKNLHVCDGSLMAENMRETPTLTLVCLAKYMAKQLAPGL